MIDHDKRMAVMQLHLKGRGKREIARLLEISRNTVSAIIAADGMVPQIRRRDTIELDEERLRQLYNQCEGRVQRVHEILVETDQVRIGYSTLSRKLRAMGLRNPVKSRSARVPDVPGEEMQHDTTVYYVQVGPQKIKLVASLLYFRYSKIRYLKFYRQFDRFRMQCFLHEALSHIGYAASICIIDNTNLARLRGRGENAVMVPQMERFANRYGFRFVCHALNHPNRKAGNERGFYTVETNFLPGRQFATMSNLNRSAFEWATERMFHRPVGKASLIPAKAFEYEKSFLNKLPPYLQAPYRDHQRTTDQYGYAAFGGNYYWIPGTDRKDLTLLEYDHWLKIFFKKQLLATFELPSEIVRNHTFFPPGHPKPSHRPNNRKQTSSREEKVLRSLSKEVDQWLTKVLKQKGISRHRLVKGIYSLHLKLAPALFLRVIRRAGHYRVTDIKSIEGIAEWLVKPSEYRMPEVDVNNEFQNRPAYLEGACSDPVDLSFYDKLLEENDHER